MPANNGNEVLRGLLGDARGTKLRGPDFGLSSHGFLLWVVHPGEAWLKEIFHLTSPLQLTLYDYFLAQLLNFFVVESQL